MSFVLLAYNQEQYVREAIEGALAQDYPNLEIIISDDCSRDRTFAIMREMADSYAGPHRIIVNQTNPNKGPLPHLYEAVALSSGGLIIGAAGDDISYPRRASVLARAWLATGADALFSRFDLIDEEGKLLAEGPELLPSEFSPGVYFPRRPIEQIRGVTSAYSRKVFDAVPLPREKIMAEDYFFALMLGLRSRRIEYVDDVLVRYRQHSQALGNVREATVGLRAFETVVQSSSRTAADILRYFERAAVSGEGVDPNWGTKAEVDLKRVRSDIAFHEFRSRWLSAAAGERLAALAAAKSWPQLRWLLPRVFGLGVLRLLKQLRTPGEAKH